MKNKIALLGMFLVLSGCNMKSPADAGAMGIGLLVVVLILFLVKI